MAAASKTRACSVCGEGGHNARTCDYAGKAIRRCGNCGDLGHNARTCETSKTEKPKKKASKQAAAKTVEAEAVGRACGICRESGHNARTCPQSSGAAPKAKATTEASQKPAAAKQKRRRARGETLATFPSTSNPGTTYEVRRGLDGVVYCTCPGWRMAKKRNGAAKARKCWHLDNVVPSLK